MSDVAEGSMASAAPATEMTLLERVADHWPEYAIEAWGLGVFMFAACAFTVLLMHPGSPVAAAIPDDTVRRALMGLAMGSTAVAIIYSPWGKRSGAHVNPSVTLTFWRLRRVDPRDAGFYMAAQFAGGTLGVVLAALVLGSVLGDPSVDYARTRPGDAGPWLALLAEALITFILMAMVLVVSNSRFERWTGMVAGALVAIYITVEAPISGMSMNPARSFASAVGAGDFADLWIYFIAPSIGMLCAAEAFIRVRGQASVACAKYRHTPRERCIFCEFHGK